MPAGVVWEVASVGSVGIRAGVMQLAGGGIRNLGAKEETRSGRGGEGAMKAKGVEAPAACVRTMLADEGQERG